MNKKIFFGVVAFLMVFVLAGCSGKGSQTSDKGGQLITDMCKQIPPETVAEITGKPIVKTQSDNQPDYCAYFTEYADDFYKLSDGTTRGGGKFFSLNYENLSVENQKKAHGMMDHKLETNPKISMDHFVAVQEGGLINTIVLILDENHFVSINRSSAKTLNEFELVDFASEIAKILKKI